MKKILILLSALLLAAACSDKSEPDYSLLHEKLMGYWEGRYEVVNLFYPEPGPPYSKGYKVDDIFFNKGVYTKYRNGEKTDEVYYYLETNNILTTYGPEDRFEFEIFGDSLYLYQLSKNNFAVKSVYYKRH